MKRARTRCGGVFDVPKLIARQQELSEQSTRPGFWDNQETAQAVLKEQDRIRAQTDGVERLSRALEDARVYLGMAEEEGDENSEAARETASALETARAELERQELQVMLGGEYDRLGAIVSIHPGAGGTEAQDWAEILLRLYLRWAERRGFKTDLADLQPGDGGGIKNATFTVEGEYAYGYLKAEAGIHRLVRISPFDANARRHTSFASVFVFPEIDDKVEVIINPADLKIDTYRASGAGGQHVNRTESAIRITHKPTGLVVTCQDERSQHKNREKAMKVLRARLFDQEQQRQQAEISSDRRAQVGTGERSERIRTYNYPQNRVSEERIDLTLYRLRDVLEGDLDAVLAPLLAEDQARRLRGAEAR